MSSSSIIVNPYDDFEPNASGYNTEPLYRGFVDLDPQRGLLRKLSDIKKMDDLYQKDIQRPEMVRADWYKAKSILEPAYYTASNVIDYGSTYRPVFYHIYNQKARNKCIVFHRRGGKSFHGALQIFRNMWFCPYVNPQYIFMAKNIRQAAKIIWPYFLNLAGSLRQTVDVSISKTDSSISIARPWVYRPGKIKRWGDVITIYVCPGENHDNVRGLWADGAIMDEMAFYSKEAWTHTISSVLADRGGWSVLTSSVNGPDHFKEIFDEYSARGEKDPTGEYLAVNRNVLQSGIFSKAYCIAKRYELGEEAWNKEFMNSWYAQGRGRVFSEALSRAAINKRIGDFPYEPAAPVETWWDLGQSKMGRTVVLFRQKIGLHYRYINAENFYHTDVREIFKWIHTKFPYQYSTHNVPHDAKQKDKFTARSWIHSALTLVPELKNGQLKVWRKPGSLVDLQNAALEMMPRCYFDARGCKKLVDAFALYGPEWDSKKGITKDTPDSGWQKDYVDAFMLSSAHTKPVDAENLTRSGRILLKDNFDPFGGF